MLSSNLWAPSAKTIHRVNRQGDAVGLASFPPSNESRVHFLIKVIDELKLSNGSSVIESVLTQMSVLWRKGSADKEDLISLLDRLTKRGLKRDEVAFTAARDCLLSDPQTDAEFRAAADFYQNYPEAVPDEKRDALKESFKAFASDHPANSDDDPDWIRDAVADIQYVGQRIGIDVDEYTQTLLERADEIESERANESEPDYDERGWEGSDSDIDDVQSMFEGLRSDLQAP